MALPACYPESFSFSSDELSAMRSIQIGHYNCGFKLYRRTGATDAYGVVTDVWAEMYEGCCGYNILKRQPAEAEGSAEIPIAAARMRVELTVVVKPFDRIDILSMYGTELAIPLRYFVNGPPLSGPTGQVIELIRDTGLALG